MLQEGCDFLAEHQELMKKVTFHFKYLAWKFWKDTQIEFLTTLEKKNYKKTKKHLLIVQTL